jgi:hypothetical protein
MMHLWFNDGNVAIGKFKHIIPYYANIIVRKCLILFAYTVQMHIIYESLSNP